MYQKCNKVIKREREDMAAHKDVGITKEYLEENYTKAGVSQEFFAAQLGITSATLRYHLRKHSIPSNKRPKAPPKVRRARRARKSDVLTREFLERKHITEDATIKTIAEEVGVSSSLVLYWMRRHSIARKVGKHKDGAGYWMDHKVGHPRANYSGYVKRHVLVWEQHHGRFLPDGWVVHHISGERSDNRQENLKAFTVSDHLRFHAFARVLAGVGRRSCPSHILAKCIPLWDFCNRALPVSE